MLRGFVFGASSGALVVAVWGGALSLAVPLPEPAPTPVAVDPDGFRDDVAGTTPGTSSGRAGSGDSLPGGTAALPGGAGSAKGTGLGGYRSESSDLGAGAASMGAGGGVWTTEEASESLTSRGAEASGGSRRMDPGRKGAGNADNGSGSADGETSTPEVESDGLGRGSADSPDAEVGSRGAPRSSNFDAEISAPMMDGTAPLHGSAADDPTTDGPVESDLIPETYVAPPGGISTAPRQ